MKKNAMKNLGFMLIVVGLVMMVLTGFNYISKEEVADLGPIEINREKTHPVRWPAIIGVVLLAGGLLLIVTDKKKTSL